MIPLLFGGGSAPNWVRWVIKIILVATFSVWTFFLAEVWWSATHGFFAFLGSTVIAVIGIGIDLAILFTD